MSMYLIENRELGIKEGFSNIKKVSIAYGLSYYGLYHALRREGKYRKDGFLVTKMNIR